MEEVYTNGLYRLLGERRTDFVIGSETGPEASMRTLLPLHAGSAVTPGALGVSSRAPAFGWSFAYYQSSMSLWAVVQPPRHAGFFRCSPLGMRSQSNTHLCQAARGLLRHASFSALRNSAKGLMDVDQQ